MTEKNLSAYMNSDLAAECCAGRSVREYTDEYASVSSLRITTEEDSKRFGKERGSYITVSFDPLHLLPSDAVTSIAETTAAELRMLADATSPHRERVLIAGLGNRHLTSDSLGPLCIDGVNVTRHLRKNEPALFEALEVCETAAFSPGVVGQTGIETLELILGAVETVRPDLLVVIDSLAARSVRRLASTIQLTDSGIAPGSGIGNRRRTISKASTGVPTIAIGAPTVVSSATLVCDALEKSGIDEIPRELESVLSTGRSFFVSPKECDIAVAELAKVITYAVNSVFSDNF